MAETRLVKPISSGSVRVSSRDLIDSSVRLAGSRELVKATRRAILVKVW